MGRQLLHLFLLSFLFVEFVQLSEAKIVKIRKIYRPKPWHYNSWRSARYHLSRRPHKSRRRPRWQRKQKKPTYTSDEQYTIEIDLPKRFDEHLSKRHRTRPKYRKYDDYSPEYSDEDDDQTLSKEKLKVRVVQEVKPKLRIKISRNDDVSESELVNESNMSSANAHQLKSNIIYPINAGQSVERDNASDGG